MYKLKHSWNIFRRHIFIQKHRIVDLTLIHRVEIKSETKIKAWTGKKIEISLKKIINVLYPFPFHSSRLTINGTGNKPVTHSI